MSTKYFTFYSDISDLSARLVMRDISNAVNQGAKEIHISMASSGGSTAAGFVIYNFLRGVNAKIITHNLGHIDSSALCMFLAGEERTSSPISRFNIHKPTNNLPKESANGKHLLFEYAKILEYDEKTIVSIYSERTVLSVDKINVMMEQGALITPSEAVDFGIISGVEAFRPPMSEPITTIGMQ